MKLFATAMVAMAFALTAVVAATAEAKERPRSDPILRFECGVTEVATMDPILNVSGNQSHKHVFFGNTNVDVKSTGWSLSRENAPTTCLRDWETSSLWFPVLWDGDEVMQVNRLVWYFRGFGDQTRVKTPPTGLELIGNYDKGEVEWRCGPGDAVFVKPPKACPAGNIIKMAVTFPNCLKVPRSGDYQVTWQGGSNVAYDPESDSCPSGYIRLPHQRVVVDFANPNGLQNPLKVSAEEGEKKLAATFAHMDIMHGEQYERFDAFMTYCIRSVKDGVRPPAGCVDRGSA